MSELELHAEPIDSPASRELLGAYVALVRARLASLGVQPGERFFVDDDAFAGPGTAWLVAYEAERSVGCGGLCSPEPGIGEVKRLFVVEGARGRGYGRALLRELERRAAAHGHGTLRLLTADALGEASALYAAEGYVLVARAQPPGGPVELEYEKPIYS